MSRIAVYPGSFDPISLGHVDVVHRGLRLFDKVIVCIAKNTSKNPHFSLDERMRMLQACFDGNQHVEVAAFTGLLVEFAKKKGACAILRGLRAASDFEYEFQMATMNRRLNPALETVFVMASEEYTFVSSSLIREIAWMGGDVSGLVPPAVIPYLKRR